MKMKVNCLNHGRCICHITLYQRAVTPCKVCTEKIETEIEILEKLFHDISSMIFTIAVNF